MLKYLFSLIQLIFSFEALYFFYLEPGYQIILKFFWFE